MIKLELPQQPQLKAIDVCFENYYKSLLEKLAKDGNTHRIIPEILKLCGNMANFKLLITDEWFNIKNKPDNLLFEYYLVCRFYLDLTKMRSSDDERYRINWISKILKCISHYPKMNELIDSDFLYDITSDYYDFQMKNKKVFNNFDEINNKLRDFLNYDNFRDRFRVTLWRLYGCEVCPYCNLIPITNNEDFSTADIEHFYPKSIFSLFCVSKFNLVPSCKDCNRQFKGSKYFHYNPRYEGLDEYFKFDFSVNASFEQTIDNYLSHSSEIKENDINLAIKLCNEDKYVEERLSTLKINSRYDSVQNRTDICKFIKDAESSRYLWLKTIENGVILEDKDKEKILNQISPFLSREIYRSRKFMNIEKGKFKADINSMFQDYIEGLLYP